MKRNQLPKVNSSFFKNRVGSKSPVSTKFRDLPIKFSFELQNRCKSTAPTVSKINFGNKSRIKRRKDFQISSQLRSSSEQKTTFRPKTEASPLVKQIVDDLINTTKQAKRKLENYEVQFERACYYNSEKFTFKQAIDAIFLRIDSCAKTVKGKDIVNFLYDLGFSDNINLLKTIFSNLRESGLSKHYTKLELLLLACNKRTKHFFNTLSSIDIGNSYPKKNTFKSVLDQLLLKLNKVWKEMDSSNQDYVEAKELANKLTKLNFTINQSEAFSMLKSRKKKQNFHDFLSLFSNALLYGLLDSIQTTIDSAGFMNISSTSILNMQRRRLLLSSIKKEI